MNPVSFVRHTAYPTPPRPRFGLSSEMTSWTRGARRKRFNHATLMARYPSVIDFLVKLLPERFPQGCPIYVHACSTGAEPDTLAAKMAMEMGTHKAAKYPIRASDVVERVVRIARKNLTTENDLEDLCEKLGEGARQYFEPVGLEALMQGLSTRRQKELANFINRGFHCYSHGEQLFQLKPELARNIVYRRQDVRDAFYQKNSGSSYDKPCVVMARNTWYHLPKPSRRALINRMWNRLAPGSLVVLGTCEYQRDDSCEVPLVMQERGFKPLSPYDPKIDYDEQGPGVMVFEKPRL